MKWCYFMFIIVIRWRHIHCLVIRMQKPCIETTNISSSPCGFSMFDLLFFCSLFLALSMFLWTYNVHVFLCFILSLYSPFFVVPSFKYVYYCGNVHLWLKNTINWMRIWIIFTKLRLFLINFFWLFVFFMTYTIHYNQHLAFYVFCI